MTEPVANDSELSYSYYQLLLRAGGVLLLVRTRSSENPPLQFLTGWCRSLPGLG